MEHFDIPTKLPQLLAVVKVLVNRVLDPDSLSVLVLKRLSDHLQQQAREKDKQLAELNAELQVRIGLCVWCACAGAWNVCRCDGRFHLTTTPFI